MAIIYHITSQMQWEAARLKGYYESSSLYTEGFIHCSEEQQVDGVLKRYFAGQTDLLKIVIETDLLQSMLKYELASSIDEIFPHIYGTINLDAVVRVEPIIAKN